MIQARTLAGDELPDFRPHDWLLRDLTGRPRCAASFQLGSGKSW
jgi:hypothetical protein